ncbi:MAG: class I tRNA ligase family protein, partial [Chloroflexota bacterium]
HGADAVRAYLMFFAEWEQGAPWNSRGIEGTVRWLNRVWNVVTEKSEVGSQKSEADERALRRVTHQTIMRVTTNFENFKFNTIISALMEMTNNLYKYRDTVYGTSAWDEAISVMLRLMAPVTPHIAEELWAKRKMKYSIHTQPWPEFDAGAAAEEEITLVLQVNGKVRDRITMPAGLSEDEAKTVAMASEAVKKYLEGKTPKKVIYVEGKLVNVVV